MITPHQQDLFEKTMRLYHGNRAGDIKTVVVNFLVTMLSQNSSNVDEAIIQFNELSREFEKLLREKFASNILRVDETQAAKFRLNGG